MAAQESMRGGRAVVFGPSGTSGDEEEEEDPPVVSSEVIRQNFSVNCNSQMVTPVFDSYQVLLSVLAQNGQVGLCFYDSKDSSVRCMRDTPDNHELHLLARGKITQFQTNKIITRTEMIIRCINLQAACALISL